MKTILIIEDNPDIRESTAEILELAGYRVLQADNGKLGVEMALQQKVELILCDIMMPELDGYGVLHMLSKNEKTSDVPFIFLTAKAERLDFRKGMEMGADDYLPKPFEPRELLARIRSVLRRSHAMPSNTPSENVQQMRFAGWTLDLTARHLLNPDGIVIMLSGAEFRLLKVFLEHPNRVLNRDQLLNLTQGRDADPFDRSIDIQISRLRQKLGEDARVPQIIKTVRNGGYVLAGQVTVEPHP